MNEFDLIKTYFAPLSGKAPGALNLSDDAALLAVPAAHELVLTTDAMAQGVHFIGDEPPETVAKKLLRVNLSDLAAMGAVPHAYFLTLMLPEGKDEYWLQSFVAGLRADQETYGVTLMGGDTVHTLGTLSLSLTALGFVPQGTALTRNGAKPGDSIYVTGTIGDAALGLQVASCRLQVKDDYLLQRYRLPSPRVGVGQALCGIAHACMDISDGLVQDMGHIAECSGVAGVIHWEKIPLSDAAKAVLRVMENPYETIAAGGDDYELLFTAPYESHEKLQAIARKLGVKITRIGEIKEGKGVKLVDKAGKDIYLSRTGYNHFADRKDVR